MSSAFQVACDPKTGMVRSATLYGEELLDGALPCETELKVNGLPLKTRLSQPADARDPLERHARLKGERFVDHFAGEPVDGHMEPEALLAFHHELRQRGGFGGEASALCDDINQQIPRPRASGLRKGAHRGFALGFDLVLGTV